MKKNPNTHIYLYAKGHYKKSTNIIKDLRLIMTERCGEYLEIDEEPYKRLVDINDMLSVLLSVTYKNITVENGNPEYFFKEFITNISPEYSWKVGYRTNQSPLMWLYQGNDVESLPEYDYWTALIYACMSILRNVSCTTIEKVDGAPLGEPDYKLFPMFKK